jgi:hypothetical protein
VNETCGCGARIEEAGLEEVREWRGSHRHEPPVLRQAPSGGFASAERGYNPIGFVVPEQTRGM